MEHFRYSFFVTFLGIVGIAVWGWHMSGDIAVAMKLMGLAIILAICKYSVTL